MIKALKAPIIAVFCGLVTLAVPATSALGAGAEAVDRSSLRVCADPHSLPFSNNQGDGYENKIAELIGAKLGVPVRYTWFPQTIGFRAKHAARPPMRLGDRRTTWI